ncbi:MAG: right-handed parallel beta-helix repeat-containing protein [Pirellulales bacterium]
MHPASTPSAHPFLLPVSLTASVFFGLFTLLAQSLLCAAELQVPAENKTIQSAIDAAEPGDTILVAQGTYHERLQLKSGVTLKSAGDDARGKLGLKRAERTIIDGDFKAAEGSGVAMAENSTLDGFTVTGVGNYDDALWEEHHKTQGEHQSHTNIGAPGTAGIAVIGISSCMVTNNIVHHIGYTGIAIMGEPGKTVTPHIYRNVTYRNMGGGIGSMKQSTAIIEENICFENFYAGIGHDNASPLVISNLCYANVRAGIGISEHSKPIVRNNKCYQNRRAGIGIRTGAETRPLVENNDCYENDMAGIGSREEASPTIRNNRCYKNKLAGIGSRTHATPTIINNECYENFMTGIGQQSGAQTILIGNHCHHNQLSGIGFATCESGTSTLIGNRVIENKLVAVGINAGWTVQLSKNELSRKAGLPPIVMVAKGATATFTENTITGGGVAGIRVAGKVNIDNNQFVGTSLRKVGPPNFAVWALPNSDITMTANKIDSWRHALLATEARVSAMNNQVSNFYKTAFMIQKSTGPNEVSNNQAVSQNPTDQVVILTESSAITKNNTVVPELVP